jgi:hypothetical protein
MTLKRSNLNTGRYVNGSGGAIGDFEIRRRMRFWEKEEEESAELAGVEGWVWRRREGEIQREC